MCSCKAISTEFLSYIWSQSSLHINAYPGVNIGKLCLELKRIDAKVSQISRMDLYICRYIQRGLEGLANIDTLRSEVEHDWATFARYWQIFCTGSRLKSTGILAMEIFNFLSKLTLMRMGPQTSAAFLLKKRRLNMEPFILAEVLISDWVTTRRLRPGMGNWSGSEIDHVHTRQCERRAGAEGIWKAKSLRV